MRILHFGKYYPPYPGGIETVTRTLVEHTNALGVPCDVLCFNHENVDREEQCGSYRIMRCATPATLYSTPLSWRGVTGWRAVHAAYDVVVIHMPNPTANVALWLSRFRGLVVLLWHSDVVRQRKLLTLYRPLQDWLIRRANLIIGATDAHIAASHATSSFGDKSRVIPYGLDPGVFARPTDSRRIGDVRRWCDGRSMVLAVGRLVPYKGFRYLVEAARLLPDDTSIVIAGAGPLHDELARHIQACGVERKVLLIGEFPQGDLAMLYRLCDVFCLPSVTKAEMFGLVQLEAMWFGKPVVSTRIPGSGVPSVNVHGETGLTVEPGRPDELAKAIRTILTDPALSRRLAANGRRAIAATYRADLVAWRHVSAYAALLGRPAPPEPPAARLQESSGEGRQRSTVSFSTGQS